MMIAMAKARQFMFIHTILKLCTESILNCSTVGNNQDLLRHYPKQYGNDGDGCLEASSITICDIYSASL